MIDEIYQMQKEALTKDVDAEKRKFLEKYMDVA